MSIAIVLGTSKLDGNTRLLVDSFINESGAELFDLSNYEFSFFDYEHKNKGDDFLPLIKKLLCFDHIVFASPVYWYSMSAQLKVFFDRLSDLLIIEKELGRKLKGKLCSVLSTGFDEKLPTCFVEPFEMTASYLHMEFKGFTYLSVQNEEDLTDIKIAIQHAMQNVT